VKSEDLPMEYSMNPSQAVSMDVLILLQGPQMNIGDTAPELILRERSW